MILVTGATGNVGRCIVRRMTAAGHQVKALTRNPGAVFDGAEVVVGDLDEQRTLPGCLEGVNKAYVMGMGPRTAEQVATFVHAAAGLRHIVLMSSLSVELERGGVVARWHREAEGAVRKSGIPWTFLRPGVFMSNALQWAASIRAEGVVRSVTGDTPVAPVHPDDIAAVAVTALSSTGHEGRAYALTGPERTSPSAQTRLLGDLLERRLTFEAVPAEAGVRSMTAFGISAEEAEVSVHSAREDNLFGIPLTTIHDLTGLAPRTFRDWAAENLNAFR
ncbi:NAD-dependent epimerase/dehydratase family protein [Nonomuraea mesophila]|uniref:NAD-dependent epimerase/dehydratase family protein n=1 Tax=Nonomuraea mesophila TaxID=2530382 RepID=A0A4R5FDH3_9ACTN|nr:NAD(P)H-binding protein [Nonomuraea mesophila]TDE47517.1 NAD-dependent epimerase/dehydratase family protein [Nonomuraea mesophila]